MLEECFLLFLSNISRMCLILSGSLYSLFRCLYSLLGSLYSLLELCIVCLGFVNYFGASPPSPPLGHGNGQPAMAKAITEAMGMANSQYVVANREYGSTNRIHSSVICNMSFISNMNYANFIWIGIPKPNFRPRKEHFEKTVCLSEYFSFPRTMSILGQYLNKLVQLLTDEYSNIDRGLASVH